MTYCTRGYLGSPAWGKYGVVDVKKGCSSYCSSNLGIGSNRKVFTCIRVRVGVDALYPLLQKMNSSTTCNVAADVEGTRTYSSGSAAQRQQRCDSFF